MESKFDISLDDFIKQNKKGGKNNTSPNKAKNQPNAKTKQQQQQQQQVNKNSPQKNGRKFKLNRNGLYSSQMINTSPKKGQGGCRCVSNSLLVGGWVQMCV